MAKSIVGGIASLIASVLLTACGGGGGSNGSAASTAGVGAATQIDPTTQSWHVATISSVGAAVIPGGGYGNVSDQPTLDWIQADGTTGSYNSLSYNAQNNWGPTQALMQGLPIEAVSTEIMAGVIATARAGSWALVSWRTPSRDILIRITGPGVDSGAVLLAASDVAGGYVNLAVTPDGFARAVWTEVTNGTIQQQLHTGHFNGGIWIIDPPLATVPTVGEIYKQIAGPDGNGWILYGAQDIYARSFNAVSGLGPEVRIDDPSLQAASNVFLIGAVKEGGNGITIVMEGSCLATRHFDGSTLSPITCIAPLDQSKGHLQTVFVDAATNGAAIVEWSYTYDKQISVSIRASGQGTWSTPVSVATNEYIVQNAVARISPTGKAAIAYTAVDSSINHSVQAITSDDGQNWSAPVLLDITSGANYIQQMDMELNTNGDPGILAFEHQSSHDAIKFDRKINGQWQPSQVLQANVDLESATVLNGLPILIGMQRLIPLPNSGWAAFWELNPSSSLVNGHPVVAAHLD